MVDNRSIIPMEIFRTDEFYVLMNSESSLWCNRRTGEIEPKPGWELANSGDPECLGIFYGLIGKVDFQGEGEARLLLVKETDPVGALPDGREVVKIRSVAFLHICGPDATNVELGLRPCKKHKGGNLNVFDLPQRATLAKTWGSIKSATSSLKNTTQHAAAMATYQVKSGLKKEIKDKEKFEKRILDELSRIFTDTDSFYFCVGPPGSSQCDLTNCLQRQCSGAPIDDRFFWNKYMLKDILEMNNDLAKAWVLPIIQGYVQIEHCNLEVDPLAFGSQRTEFITVGIISRRSRYRAGTRYKRRGLDEDGKCANYVETEQFLATADHHISFVMVRGSVPLFWSQPGFKYRPPPHIDKGEAETKLAFEKHMNEELELYGPVCIVNLVEQTGKEKIIWDGFTEQVMSFDSPLVTYSTFDFHEHCRGMKFENVSYLIARLEEPLQEMGFCWKDEQGVICQQNGIFRVNCIDCLDRTNVVQTALGKAILETQLTKLGLLSPEGVFPMPLRTTFQLLWANNGDIISKQYAGTNALKGDYTRTGERKLTGMMKDGMNSANRYLRRVLLDDLRQLSIEVCMGYELSPLTYSSTLTYEILDVVSTQDYSCPSTYVERELLLGMAVYNFSRYYLSRFKDVYRQATIDIMQGQVVSEDMLSEHEDADSNATAEHVKLLIEDCKKLLISDSTLIVGAWGLINADPMTGDPNETDMDTILILTRTSYYVADYDDEIDQVTKCQKVLLSDISMVELGPMEIGQNPLQLFNKGKNKQTGHQCLRFRYNIDNNAGYSHTFRSSNLRFFNNVAIVIKTEEEMLESLRAICDCFRVALEVANEDHVQWHLGAPINKLTTPVSPNSLPTMPRNVSETQLVNLKNVGTKAISNMTSKFSRIGSSIRRKSSATQEMPLPEFAMEEEVVVIDYEDGETKSKRDVCETNNDTFLPNVGIVMSNTAIQHSQDLDADDFILEGEIIDGSRPSSLTVSMPVELKVRTFSHSSGEVDIDKDHLKPGDSSTSVSNKLELSLGSITSSQSENALKSLKLGFSNATNVLTSPSAVAVLSPLTKLAKGMQTLGANLDIRRLKQGKTNYEPTSETDRLKELWIASKCKSKLIAV